MNADGSEQVRLTNNSGVSNFNIEWSPDGKKITYIDEINGIFAINADGTGSHTKLTNNGAWHVIHFWSPNGSKIRGLQITRIIVYRYK